MDVRRMLLDESAYVRRRADTAVVLIRNTEHSCMVFEPHQTLRMQPDRAQYVSIKDKSAAVRVASR